MTNTYLKQALHVVVDYVKDLRPVKNVDCGAFADPVKDAVALFALLNGNVRYFYARNGKKYLYCFINNDANIDVAKFILKSNGMNPKLHISRYYPEPMLAFRVPASDFKNNNTAAAFKQNLFDYRMIYDMRNGAALSRLQEIRQHMAKQRTK
ncbi:MAG: hypothetical protein R8M71_00530 [Alphaproteobacteria bacterium]|nr:hypothetical protein [Alphaproteobacteria bacterium]